MKLDKDGLHKMFNDDTLHFIKAISRGRSGGRGYFWYRKDRKTSPFDGVDYEPKFKRACAASVCDDVYIGLGHDPSVRTEWTRAKSANVVQFPGLFMDIDVSQPGGAAHSQSALPACNDDALAFIKQLPIQPSWINSSGYGYHCFWWVQDTDCSSSERRNAFQVELERASGEVRYLASQQGWKLDNVCDLARITRVPGSLNHKRPENPVPVEAILRNGPIYASLSELKFCDLPDLANESTADDFLCTGLSESASRGLDLLGYDSFWAQAMAKARKADTPMPNGNFAAIVQGCEFVKSSLSHCARLPEPEWFTLLSILGGCHDVEKLAHAISSQDVRYDKEETTNKFAHASDFKFNCKKIASAHPEACSSCGFRDLVSSPVDLGWYVKDIVALSTQYAYSPEDDRFIDLARPGRELLPRGFDIEHGAKLSRASDNLVQSKVLRRISRRDYLPGQKTFLRDGPMWVLNSYLRPELSLVRDKKTEEIFVSHLTLLCNNDEAASQRLLRYLAHLVQRPDKINHAILIQAGQGIGKTILGNLMRDILGDENVKMERFEKVNARFAQHISNKQLLVIEELQAEKREAYNEVKSLITDEWGSFEPKGGKIYRARNPLGILIFTNMDVPILLEQGDRRFHVIRGPEQPMTPEYFESFCSIVSANPGAVRAYLMSVDLSGFDPKAPPPMTKAKTELQTASKGLIETAISDAVEEHDGPAIRDITTRTEWEDFLRQKLGRIPLGNLPAIMKRSGFRSAGQFNVNRAKRPDGPAKPRPWVIRNFENYEDDPARIKLAYESSPT